MGTIIPINNTALRLPSYYSDDTVRKVARKVTVKGALRALDTFQAFKERFRTEEDVLHEIFVARIGTSETRCPGCGHQALLSYKRIAHTKQYQCKYCKSKVSPLKGTPIGGTHLPLDKVFECIWKMLTSGGHPVTGAEIQREYGWKISTAWALLHKLRKDWMGVINMSFAFDKYEEVEMDEVYITTEIPEGQKNEKLKRGPESQRQVKVFTISGRKSGVFKAIVSMEINTATAVAALHRAGVTQYNSIKTDEKSIYPRLEEYGFEHAACNHNKKQYVGDENAHTNTLEGGHALMKTGYIWVHKGITRKYVTSYLYETAFRLSVRNKSKMSVIDLMLENLSPLF